MSNMENQVGPGSIILTAIPPSKKIPPTISAALFLFSFAIAAAIVAPTKVPSA